jgi:hypothetical protein
VVRSRDEFEDRESEPGPGEELLDAMLDDLLETLLAESPGLVDFATAVIRHLTTASAGGVGRSEIVRDVVELLRTVQEEGEPLPIRRLSDRPEVLASFFQNADLLEPSSREAAGIARLVAGALESVGDLE